MTKLFHRCLMLAWMSSVALMISGCSRSLNPPIIQLEFPKDYRGVVHLIFDDESGVEPTVNGNTFAYTIPDSGVLRIKRSGLLGNWHKETALFAGGSKLPIFEFDTNLTNAVALHSIGTSQHVFPPYETTSFFVGTKQECETHKQLERQR